MKRDAIRDKLDDVADNFHFQRLQPLLHFEVSLIGCDEKEVFHGLVGAFEESGYEGGGFYRQEVAGRMLLACLPKPDAKLADLLANSAPNFNLSVEQFPFYMALSFGRDTFRNTVRELSEESEYSEQEKKSFDSYLYWTSLSEAKMLEEVSRCKQRAEQDVPPKSDRAGG